jgi:hypothetical protein
MPRALVVGCPLHVASCMLPVAYVVGIYPWLLRSAILVGGSVRGKLLLDDHRCRSISCLIGIGQVKNIYLAVNTLVICLLIV